MPFLRLVDVRGMAWGAATRLHIFLTKGVASIAEHVNIQRTSLALEPEDVLDKGSSNPELGEKSSCNSSFPSFGFTPGEHEKISGNGNDVQ